ncbi:MAG: hypothetical protein ACP5UO_05760 [Thermoplasmata archaeon]
MRAEFLGQEKVVLLGVVKGLRDAGRSVDSTYSRERFDILLLPITQEEVSGIRQYIREPSEVEMDDIELIYEYHIRKFGDTSIPPEAYVTAVRLADRDGIEVAGIDIPSGVYEGIFVNNVQLSDLLSLSLRKRRLLKRRWNLKDPVSFSLEWDRYINRGGYRNVEKERVRYMAEEIVKRKKGSTLVILEVERFREIVDLLKNSLQGYRFQESVE